MRPAKHALPMKNALRSSAVQSLGGRPSSLPNWWTGRASPYPFSANPQSGFTVDRAAPVPSSGVPIVSFFGGFVPPK